MFANSDLPPEVAYVVAAVSGFTALLNLAFVGVGVKKLKRKFHYLLVLSLCISDFCLNISFICVSVTSMFRSLQQNVRLCIFQIFMIFFGIVTSYSLVFVICYERLLVVQSKNFGIRQLLDRFKYVLIGLTLGLDLMFTMETTLFVPHKKAIDYCSPSNLYGDQYRSFAEFFAASTTIILAGIIVTTLRTSSLIWKIFFKRRNKLDDSANVEINVDSYRPNYRHDTEKMKQNCKVNNCEGVPLQQTCSKEKNICEGLERRSENITHNGAPAVQIDDRINTMSDKISHLVDLLKTDRMMVNNNSCQIPVINKTEMNNYKKKKLNAWEIRAFTSSLIIALTTVILTLPFVMSFYHDLYNMGVSTLSKQSRLIIGIPLQIHSILNPFLYAWRLPEIKEEFLKIIKLKKTNNL